MAESRFITNPGEQTAAQSLPFVEPYVVQDIYVSGFRPTEPIGDDLFRLTGYVRQCNNHDGLPELVVNARIILSLETLTALAMAVIGPHGGRAQ